MKLMPELLQHKCISYLVMDHYPEVDAKYGLDEQHWFFVGRGNDKLGAILSFTLQGIMVHAVTFRFCAPRLQHELVQRLGLVSADTTSGAGAVEWNPETEELSTESEAALKGLLDVAQGILSDVVSGKIAISAQELAESLPKVGLPPESFNPDQDEAPLTDELQAELSEAELTLAATEAPRVVRERIGQQRYRKGLEQLWQGRCAVTGISTACLLRASHAKPWAECVSGAERLSPYNGFLLNVALDALFDQFLISFADDGSILLAPSLKFEELAALGISPELKLSKVVTQHLPFLAYHRTRFYAAQAE